jgi:hypothetical protein
MLGSNPSADSGAKPCRGELRLTSAICFFMGWPNRDKSWGRRGKAPAMLSDASILLQPSFLPRCFSAQNPFDGTSVFFLDKSWGVPPDHRR